MVVLLMDICVLASGSKGNVVYVSSGTTKILIDIGTSSLYAERKLKEIDVDPNDIDAVLITHSHSDHVAGIRVFAKKYNPKIYLSKEMLSEIKFEIDNYEFINGDFSVGNLSVEVIKTSHDVIDSNGYILNYNDKSVAYITDTGYINKKNSKRLRNKDMYIMESNHDVEMLMEGEYPYYLKQRILGDLGHLSNESSAGYLSEYVGPNTKIITLSHLSEDNNDPEVALSTLRSVFNENNIEFDNVCIASQKDRSDMVKL